MHAKTPNRFETRLPDAEAPHSSIGLSPAKPLSAAFAKALGGKPPAPHLEGARVTGPAPGKGQTSIAGGPARERVLPVKQIAPRKGHR